MSDNKKYYYLKLKENFFDSDSLIILESMPDGYLYSNILLKLYLRSLKNEGRLMFNDRIPYNPTVLAQITRHSVGVMEKALDLFQEMELIEILDNGAIYISDIQNFIGESSTEADRKREYRARIQAEKEGKHQLLGQMSDQMSGQMSDKPPPEIEIELDIEKEIDKSKKEQPVLTKNDKEKVIDTWNDLGLQQLRDIKSNTKRYESLKARVEEYSLDEVVQAISSVKDSSFLKGNNDRDWTITFDWLVKPNNFIKVLEGNYIDKDVKANKNNGKSKWDVDAS